MAANDDNNKLNDTYYNASSDDTFEVTQDSNYDFSFLDPQQRAKLEEEWRRELAKTEEEIQTLRQVLTAKVKQSHELKRKLGITVWKEFREDMEQGIKNIQETTASGLGIFTTPAYQKTTEAVKIASEKTTSAFGSLGGSVARKLGEVKNSNAFKSFEERVGYAVTNVKSKMSGSRSNSTNSFEDALNSTQRRTSQGNTPSTTPTIAEDKPIS